MITKKKKETFLVVLTENHHDRQRLSGFFFLPSCVHPPEKTIDADGQEKKQLEEERTSGVLHTTQIEYLNMKDITRSFYLIFSRDDFYLQYALYSI